MHKKYYLNSKNDLKRPLEAFIQDLWANFQFQISKRAITLAEMARKFLDK